MAYVSQERKAKIALAVKDVFKKYNVKGSLAVNHYSTLVVNIKSGALDFISNYNNAIEVRDPTNNHFINKAENYIQVNEYHYDKHFTDEALSFFTELMAAIKSDGWFDKSDLQSDYFHVDFYININVGKWDKPYVFTA